jgi:hypothetical protein
MGSNIPHAFFHGLGELRFGALIFQLEPSVLDLSCSPTIFNTFPCKLGVTLWASDEINLATTNNSRRRYAKGWIAI